MTLYDDRRGVTGPEFAVACVTVFLLVMATIDFGTLFTMKHAVNYGLVKAARYAVVNSTSATTASIKSTFVTAVTSAIGSAKASTCTVTTTFPSGEVVGGTVVINASCNWTPSAAPLDKLAAVAVAASETLTIQH